VEGTVTGPHRVLNPESLPPAKGFAHAVAAAAGTTVHLGGQAGHDSEGSLVSDDLVEQFDQAAANVVAALASAGGRPEHIVSMHIYTTDVDAYRAALPALGGAYRRHFGRRYPAIALMGVTGLFDPAAKVELVCTAVIPAS
jgi:enamine deaminase RidA (YjgF/YER057c/UK114 family)